MTREQAINYLKSSGMSEEQIETVINAFTCDDCISRSEALKHSHIEYDDDGVGHRVVYTEDIEELPTVTPKERWIPVSERLPKEEGWYLVSLGNAWSENNLGKVIQGKKIYDSHVRLSQYKGGKFYHGMVAAWMGKPEPYKEIEEEERG